jgi:hypothetical protein
MRFFTVFELESVLTCELKKEEGKLTCCMVRLMHTFLSFDEQAEFFFQLQARHAVQL